MPSDISPAPIVTVSDVEYVGFGPRLAAFLIDTLIILACNNAVGVATAFACNIGKFDPNTALHGIYAATFVLDVAYFAFFISGKWQATPGKRLMGIHVIREDRRPISAALASGRYLASMLSAIFLGIGYLTVIWTDQHKALHDMAYKTRVVRGKAPMSRQAAIVEPAPSVGAAP